MVKKRNQESSEAAASAHAWVCAFEGARSGPCTIVQKLTHLNEENAISEPRKKSDPTLFWNPAMVTPTW